MINRVYIIGTGGHAKVVAQCAKELGIEPIFIAETISRDSSIKVVSESDFFINPPAGTNWGIICGVGSVKSMNTRLDILKKFNSFSSNFVSIISKHAIVSQNSKISNGVFIAPNAVICAGASIASHSIINTSATIEHDCSIGENSHVATGAILLGNVNVGSNVFVGAGTVIMQSLMIGNNITIGAASFCNINLEEGFETWIGSPVRILKKEGSK